jgi:hypothetical protein
VSGYLDTSMAVRYLVRDVPEMAEQAATVIDGEEILWITGVALVEADYVMRSVYLLTESPCGLDCDLESRLPALDQHDFVLDGGTGEGPGSRHEHVDLRADTELGQVDAGFD